MLVQRPPTVTLTARTPRASTLRLTCKACLAHRGGHGSSTSGQALHQASCASKRKQDTSPLAKQLQEQMAQGVCQAALMAVVLLGSAAAGSVQPGPAWAQDTWTGPARVVDGDTLYIQDQKFRLYGVDAPEKTQACANALGQPYQCGIVSKDALTQKVGNQVVSCKAKQTDQYGRSVAVCSLVGPFGQQDLNKWLVDNGYAVAYKEYSKDYIADEEAAKAAKKGIWAGSFEYPALWRKEEKAGLPHPPFASPFPSLPSSPAAALAAISSGLPGAAAPGAAGGSSAAPDVCGKGVAPIKGNINGKGTKIYHVPGGPFYDKVVIEPEKGEAYFCSEADAIKAGFRAVAGAAAK